LRLVPWLIAMAYLAVHLFTLAPSLEDIDSINFALGLRDFDPAQHQPHPPGYPIYIAAGRLSLAVVNLMRPRLDRVAAEALALSVLSAVAGALALVFAWQVFNLVAGDARGGARSRVPLWATILLAACPLFWVTGIRPMSDMPGLAAALGSQALLLSGRVSAGGFLAGLALGIRSQTLWLTAPLIGLELYNVRGDRAMRDRIRVVVLAGAGALCWAVPLVIAAGGIKAYWAALGTQAGEDFAFVDMLWAGPSPRRLAFGLIHTLVLPWASFPLAGIVLALATIGGVLLLMRERRTIAIVLAAFGPYAAFHLVFQETVTVRYALPLIPPIAFLVARALAVAGPITNIIATPVAVVSLMVGVPTAIDYASAPHPAFRAIADASRRAAVDRPAMVTSHFELRRPLRAAEPTGLPVVYAPHQHEWLELARYWEGGGRGLVWFLANPKRTDLDLIDPHSRRDVVRYRWQVEGRPELSGTRPAAVDWYRLRPPGWFLGEGWSLTPETGGLTQATGTGLDHRPVVGYIRQYAGPMHAVIGGRHLGSAADPPAGLEMTLDGRVIDGWTVTPRDPAFLRFIELPRGVAGPEGSYARLTVRAITPSQPPGALVQHAEKAPVAIRQFDIQPASRAIFGFGPGWHDEEFERVTGLRWRWTSDRAVVRVRGPLRPIRVRMRGESPLKYFDVAPVLTLSAGDRVIERLRPSSDWTWEVIVPADALVDASGELRLETNHVFVPSEVTGSPDTRRLGLRVFAIEVETAR
jgi:hypothetical protein